MPALGRRVPLPRTPGDVKEELKREADRERARRWVQANRRRRVAVWDDPPAELMSVPAAAERLGATVRYVRLAVCRGVVRSWPAAAGRALGLLPEGWPAREEWVVDWAEVSTMPAVAQGERTGEKARVAAAPPGAAAGVRYFLAVGPLVVHPADGCPGDCAVHAPSGHPLRDAPLRWWRNPVAVARQCRHGVQHADPDGIAGQVPAGVCSGECCGCCTPPGVV